MAAQIFTDPGLILAGVMLSGATKRAFLLQNANHIATWVGDGDDMAGWKLQSITAETVTLHKGKSCYRVALVSRKMTDSASWV